MSEGRSWKTPAAVIGIITVLLTGIGLYINKKGADLEIQKQQYQKQKDETDKLEQDKKNQEIQDRVAELNRQRTEAELHVQDFETKIQQTYRQIQDYDFKQNDPSASELDREEDHKSYLIARENLDIFSKSKRQYELQADELSKEINDLTK